MPASQYRSFENKATQPWRKPRCSASIRSDLELCGAVVDLQTLRHRPLAAPMAMSQASSTVIALHKDQLFVWQARRRTTLTVLQGRVWITLSNCLEDHFLDGGACLQLPAQSRVLISGESTARVRIAASNDRTALSQHQSLRHQEIEFMPPLFG